MVADWGARTSGPESKIARNFAVDTGEIRVTFS